MKNVIFNVFAFKEDYLNSPQIGGKISSKTIDLYLKNIYVSLYSAKKKNPTDDVAIVTNNPLPTLYQNLYESAGIKIFVIKFQDYLMPKSFKWALAFFKLNALKYMVKNTTYDKFLLLDADTITVKAYNDLWQESEFGIILYDLRHTYKHPVREQIMKDYRLLFENERNIVQYGGEFIGGKKKDLENFIEICDTVYNRIVEKNYSISKDSGDELIISIAASMLNNIFDSGAYISRYWTGKFYLVSTNYFYDPVCIWHVPGEKKSGLLRIYKLIGKNGSILNNTKKMSKILGLPPIIRRYSLSNLWYIAKDRLRIY